MDKYTSTLSPNNLGANVISLLQGTVCDILNADTQLSKVVSFLPENIKDIDSQVKTALGKQGMVATVMTPDVSYQGRREDHAYYDFTDAEIDIVENPVVNRASNRKAEDFASAQDTALRAIYVLENSDLGDFNVKGVTSGEYDGLLVTKVTFDAFCKLQPEGPEPEPEWKSGIKLTRISGVFSKEDVSPRIAVADALDPDYQTWMKITAVNAENGEEETVVFDLAKNVGSTGVNVMRLFSFGTASAIYFHDIGQPGAIQITGFDTVITGRLSHSITKQLSTSLAPYKFANMFLAKYTGRGFRLDNLTLDAEILTPGCYFKMFSAMDQTSGYSSYFEGDNSITLEMKSNANGSCYCLFYGCRAAADATLSVTLRYIGHATCLCNSGQYGAFTGADATLISAIKKVSVYFSGESYLSEDYLAFVTKYSIFKTRLSTYKAFWGFTSGTKGVEYHFPSSAKDFATVLLQPGGTSPTYVFDL